MAAKAFNHPRIFQLCSQYLHGFDISNIGELSAVSQFSSQKYLSLTGPTWHLQNWKHHIGNIDNFMVNAGSKEQIKALVNLGINNFGVRLSAGKQGDYSSSSSRFGLDWDTLKHLQLNKQICGLHVHRGFGDNSLDFYIDTLNKASSLVREIPLELNYLNLGGGSHKVDFGILAKTIHNKLINPLFKVYFELGDFLFLNTGFLITRVVDIVCKEKNLWQVTLDTSKDCHLKWSSPYYLLPSSKNGEAFRTQFFGSTCYEYDHIGNCVLFSDKGFPLNVGDPLLFGGVTGYSYSWNTAFNGIKEAKMIFYER